MSVFSSSYLGALPPETRRAAELKFAILANGLRLTDAAKTGLFGGPDRVKAPIRTRSGVSGGLDLQLAHELFVNAPVAEPFAAHSDLVMDWNGETFSITWAAAANVVTPLPEPEYYSRRTADGYEQMVRVGQMCSPDRFCYGMTGPLCVFWPPHDRCRFCSIGRNHPADASHKRDDHLLEVLEAAMSERAWPAQHVLLGGGTPSGPDMGALLAGDLCRKIKSRFAISVYVMIVAPLEDRFVDEVCDAGTDELGMNLEFWSEAAWASYIPGKRERVGKSRYLRALEHAVRLIGPVRTRSILIVGLESLEETLAGVQALVNMGVMPILSPFRPLEGTDLAEGRGFSTEEYVALFEDAVRVCERAGVPLGPTCVCCQNNTLSLPFGDSYRRYVRRSQSEGQSASV